MNLWHHMASHYLKELQNSVGDDFDGFNGEQLELLKQLSGMKEKKRGRPDTRDRDEWLVAEAEKQRANETTMSFAAACRIVIEKNEVQEYFPARTDAAFRAVRKRVNDTKK